jgi:two-component system sporulation sensor kinase A
LLERFPRLTISLLREVSARLRDFDRRYAEYAVQAQRLSLLERLAQSLAKRLEPPLDVIADEAAALDSVAPAARLSAKDRIREQVNWTSSIISELLELTRGTGTKTVFTQTNYAQLVKPLIDGMRPELAARSIGIEWENHPPEASVLADPARLVHLFKNLIHSACDTMPTGGRIKLRFDQKEKQIVTEIEDAGGAVDPETAARLFEPFVIGGRGRGADVGLAICKKIVEDHGGRIHVHSDKGGTTTFVFRLPLADKLEPTVVA